MTDTLKLGVVGTGLMAEIYTAILQQRSDCTVVAVVGNTEDKTRKFAERHGVTAHPGADYQRLYARHPEITATVITTPEWVRREPLAAAVQHGQHIILEKPFAASLAEARELEVLLAGHTGVLEVCHVLRYSPRFAALKHAVTAGRLGEVRHIHARRNSNSRRAQRVLGKTDLAFWLTPHDIDIMRWVTGSEVSEVYALARNGLRSADDYLIANLRFANGVDAVLEISWCSPPVSGTQRAALFEVYGTAGIAEVDDYDMNVRIFASEERVSAPDTYEDFEIAGFRRGFFENMINAYIDRIKRSERPPSAVKDAVATVAACDMVRRSIEQRAVVKDGFV